MHDASGRVADQGTSIEPTAIPRRLRTINPVTRTAETIEEAAIAGLLGPIVILGDPGLGKSMLTQKLGREGQNRYVRAGTFVRSRDPARFLPQVGGRLVIDGLDEVASAAVGGGVDAVLEQLSTIGSPPFILSSREADWRGASARVRVEDDYGETVSILHLDPFDRSDADAFLAAFFPDVDAGAILDHLAARGLEEIYRNPLTLRMIGEVAQAEVALPGSRADLLERACKLMLREENPRHQDAPHALQSDEGLLLATGAICASALLCDRSGVYTGPMSRTPDDFLHLSAVQNLPLADAASDALKTRLFQADGEARFIAGHRIIAEYLGARWLAACFDHGATERRIRSLVTKAGGVPTSLRGLNAWLAHFSSGLAPGCITADPYAVLRYGNAETIPLEQARTLLRELAKLSDQDPYFRAEDWGRHPAAGLMRIELKDEILALLSDERTHAHLTFLLLEVMAGSPIAGPLAHDLEAVLFDPDRLFGARSRAAHVLIADAALNPIRPMVERLLALGDSDSQRLAFEVLTELGLAAVPIDLAVETLLAHLGLTVVPVDRRRQREHVVYIRRGLFSALEVPQLHAFLDHLAEYAAPLMDYAEYWTKEEAADAVRTAVLTALQADPSATPDQVWRWLCWVRHYEGYSTDTKQALQQQFKENVSLRRGIQATALLSVPAEELRLTAFRFREISAGLIPDDEDVIALIELLGIRSDDAPDLQQLRELASLARSRAGLAAGVREAAIRVSGADPIIVRDLDELSKPVVDEYEEKRNRKLADAEAKRRQTYRKIREDHAAQARSIRAGDFRWLNQTSKVYLGRFAEFSKDDEPQIRVEKFLGPGLAEDAFLGFMAALHRTDLPSAAEIAQSHAEGRQWNVEPALVCGVAEMIRRAVPLDTVPRPTLEAAYMAWRRQPESNIVGQVEIGPALEEIILADDIGAEAFFRASIEPQLQARSEIVYDLYLLTHDPRWSMLAGRLAVDWLIRHTALPIETEVELLDAAMRYGDRRHLGQLVTAGMSRVHASFEALMEWLATDFVLDFDRTRRYLTDAAHSDRTFLWRIRRRVAGGRREVFVSLTIEQRTFIVEVFGEAWPQTERPAGSSSGDINPWDASDFVERVIYSIAAEPTAAATEALQHLLSNAAPSYTDTLRHALALQRKLRRDHEYVPATVDQVRSIVSNALPETIDDMRAYLGDRVATVQERMHATNTDMWEAYWDGAKPRPENFCRNRLVEHISGQLPAAIRFEPEMHMPEQKRADIAAIRDSIGLPVEIKGQWHPEVWDAPVDQLAARYTRDWHAEGRGVYIVIWFGNVPGKELPAHPDGIARPTTPEMLRNILMARIPEHMRDLIDIYIVDVSRMR
ncbi:hypothetical protein KXS07_29900 [Inquilinus limosus]|uniref:hypothetical protein n=1 Tax=Inquilinus limosus TaxID=171674 RepID=UPI003F143483